MATTPADPFDDWHRQLAEQRSRIRGLGELDSGVFNRRPEEGRWSIGENLEHLSLSIGPYLGAMERAIDEARREGRTGSGPWKRGFLVGWFVNSVEPPVKLRVPTFRMLVPERALDRDRVVEQLLRLTGDFGGIIDSMRGLDLGAVKFPSPVLPLLKLDLGSAVDLNLSHNRRHLWAIRRILDDDEPTA
jgi:hypothetical protein